MVDALSNWKPKNDGLWLKVVDGEPQTVRVLTLDPIISIDKWANTRYAFVVWNWTLGKAQIWQVPPGVLKQLTAIHRDEDLGPLNKVDVKITATGEEKEKRYTINTMPKSKKLEREMVDAASKIKLEELIKDNRGRLSEYDEDEDIVTDVSEDESPGYAAARAQADKLKGVEAEDIRTGADEAFPDDSDAPDDVNAETTLDEVNIDDIPF